jgi:hypothetical protein
MSDGEETDRPRDERGGCGDGAQGRAGEGEVPLSETPQRDSVFGGKSAVGREGDEGGEMTRRNEIIGTVVIWLLIFGSIAWRSRYPPTVISTFHLSSAAEKRIADLKARSEVLSQRAFNAAVNNDNATERAASEEQKKLDDEADAIEDAEFEAWYGTGNPKGLALLKAAEAAK